MGNWRGRRNPRIFRRPTDVAPYYATVFRGTTLNGLSLSRVRSRGIFSTRSLMMLRWISSVPPAIELAGTDTRISASNPLMGLSSQVSSASGPSSDVCTRAAARAMIDSRSEQESLLRGE